MHRIYRHKLLIIISIVYFHSRALNIRFKKKCAALPTPLIVDQSPLSLPTEENVSFGPSSCYNSFERQKQAEQESYYLQKQK